MANSTEEIELQSSIDYSDDVQYSNAVFAIGRVETDAGGLSLNKIWEETENLRKLLLRVPKEKRAILIADSVSRNLLAKYQKSSDDPVRTQMCILIMFALRLIKASKTKEDNPNIDIIKAIVRLVTYRVKRDDKLLEVLRELVQTIDKDGDDNEALGRKIEFGIDILANDGDWKNKLRQIIEVYKGKADVTGIIKGGESGDAFDAVWEALIDDEMFVAEMRESSLGEEFNLLLLFNIYGLMYPWAYRKIRGAGAITKYIGESRNSKSGYYTKDYFNQYQIEKLSQGIKSDTMLKRIQGIINNLKPTT